MRLWFHRILALGCVVPALVAALPAAARTEVDVALVIAVDISSSMDRDEQELQREGYVEAFRSPLVHEAISQGEFGRIAVVYIEWSGEGDQQVVVPWTVIADPEYAIGFAERLSRMPIRGASRTSISGVIEFATRLFEASGVEALRRVIDVSGDGPNNEGRSVLEARDAAVEQGIAINGLPITLKRADSLTDIGALDLYFRECVIGGPGAFTIPVHEREQFGEAIRMKLIREVAGTPEAYPIVHVAEQADEVDCLTSDLRFLSPPD